jgi:hypothetical protein
MDGTSTFDVGLRHLNMRLHAALINPLALAILL